MRNRERENEQYTADAIYESAQLHSAETVRALYHKADGISDDFTGSIKTSLVCDNKEEIYSGEEDIPSFSETTFAATVKDENDFRFSAEIDSNANPVRFTLEENGQRFMGYTEDDRMIISRISYNIEKEGKEKHIHFYNELGDDVTREYLSISYMTETEQSFLDEEVYNGVYETPECIENIADAELSVNNLIRETGKVLDEIEEIHIDEYEEEQE